jgi:hypothetical protein
VIRGLMRSRKAIVVTDGGSCKPHPSSTHRRRHQRPRSRRSACRVSARDGGYRCRVRPRPVGGATSRPCGCVDQGEIGQHVETTAYVPNAGRVVGQNRMESGKSESSVVLPQRWLRQHASLRSIRRATNR